jgi:carbamoyl-phosphate synthase small subunit
VLTLQDGTCWEGYGSGPHVSGEVVFNTASSGYPQSLTDPSYAGQILVFAFPMVGNYGVDAHWLEGTVPHVRAVVTSSLEAGTRAGEPLSEWLEARGIPFMSGVDTRALVRHLRSRGTLEGTTGAPGAGFVPSGERPHYVHQVSTPEVRDLGGRGPTVAVMDYGVKANILRCLLELGCHVVQFPHSAQPEEVLEIGPDGVLLSNGPGDPALLDDEVAVVRKLFGKVPLFGICLGMQLIARAAGADTEKLLFGHRGVNHPVVDLRTGRGFQTSQNHGYAVPSAGLERTGLEVTHRNLGDGSVEGLRHRELPLWGVQFHPEAFPGPEDPAFFFSEFLETVKGAQQ